MHDVLCGVSAACTPFHAMPHVPVECRCGAWLAWSMLPAATHFAQGVQNLLSVFSSVRSRDMGMLRMCRVEMPENEVPSLS